MIQSWLAGRLLNWVLARLRAGDIRPLMLLDGDEVELTFPGQNSFAGVHKGKEAHRRWLERLVKVGVQNHADQVVAVGPPWRMTVCMRGHDFAHSPEGELVYENRYVLWGRLRWGKLQDYEVYEDTEQTAKFDRWLSEHESSLAAV